MGMPRHSTKHTHLQYRLWYSADIGEGRQPEGRWMVADVSPTLNLTRGARSGSYGENPIVVQHSLAVYDKIWGDKKRTVSMLQKVRQSLIR